ncbi:MAG: sigma-70 family RNA polymerase sigma factor [bacterium]|nr:sigma-70 family RNA polymerase sigma factor [bacterium]
MTAPGDITQLLVAVRDGETSAMDRLFPLVYDELRGMARQRLRRGGPEQTLNTTALVHEAYLKLVDQTRAQWNDRGHFLAVASVAMRHILVDYARRKTAQKRGGEEQPEVLEENQLGVVARAEEILAIDQALGSLAELNERLSKLVELRFFGGLSVAETAHVLDVSERTVKRDWRKARAYLYRALQEPRDD